MIFYGEHVRNTSTTDLLQDIEAQVNELRKYEHSLDSRRALLISTGALWQAIADHAEEQHGSDCITPVVRAATDACLAAAHALCAGLYALPSSLTVKSNTQLAIIRNAIAFLRNQDDLPIRAPLRWLEGYEHYAVFPERYAHAARALRAQLSPNVCVIGIRSIGVSLAAAVAAACGTDWLHSVRPKGHPYARRLHAHQMAAMIRGSSGDSSYLIVDEGPGRSGSTFLAVVDWLLEHGISGDRIWLFTSHRGPPGAAADESIRRRWQNLQCVNCDFTPKIPFGDSNRLLEISAGAWRKHLKTRVTPPVDAARERRKFLLPARGGEELHLAKFAGLTGTAALKLGRARALSRLHLGPAAHALQNGFLVQSWLQSATVMDRELARQHRGALLDALTRYLRFVARTRNSLRSAGASPATLLENARSNIALVLGEELANDLTRIHLQHPPQPGPCCWTDNRMQIWEWLLMPDGCVLKTDALDHACGHDYVGPQPLAWDLAGAAVELELTAAEQEQLISVLGQSGRAAAELPAYLVAYAGFQLGAYTLALESAGNEGPERQRLLAQRSRYEDIARHLQQSPVLLT